MNPGLATAFCVGYTLVMSEKALASAKLHGSDEVVRQIAYEWGHTLCNRLDIQVHPSGLERADWARPLVVACNHQSLLDIPVLISGLGRAFGFLTKKELFRFPGFGPAMRRLGCVSIDRRNADSARASIAHAADRVRSGSSIVVFPEGTRSEDGRLKPFKKGPFHLVQAADVPLVPVALVGTNRILRKNELLVHAGRVEVRVGAPITMRAGTESEQRDQLQRDLRAALLSLGLQDSSSRA